MQAVVFQSPAVEIHDYQCREHVRGLGPEEETEGHEIVLPRRGMFVRHVAGTSVVADPHCALFFSRGESYRVSHPAGGGDRCTVLSFSRARLRLGLADFDPAAMEAEAPRFPRTHIPTSPTVDLLHRRLLRAARATQEPLAIEEIAFSLLGWLAAATANSSRRRSRPVRHATTQRGLDELVQATKEQLSLRLDAKLRLEEIAAAVHTSPFHLSRLFRAQTGSCLSTYHRRLRLRTALERILDGERDLTRLALELGFSHHSHFGSAFRKEFGLTPSASRDPVSLSVLQAHAARLRRFSNG